jgi:DNA repair protein RadC
MVDARLEPITPVFRTLTLTQPIREKRDDTQRMRANARDTRVLTIFIAKSSEFPAKKLSPRGRNRIGERRTMKERAKPDARERIRKRGAKNLTDSELVALLLRTGTRNRPVMGLAGKVVGVLDESKAETDFEVLNRIEGMGDTKAGTVLAALELGRRYSGIIHRKIRTAADVFPLVQHFADRKQEQFICVSLNGAHEVLAVRVVSVGILNKTIVHPREVFGDPIADRAAAVIVCHNHPSGQLEPSEEDRAITRRLAEAGNILGISLLDHLILSPRGGYFSFVDSGVPFG